MRAASWGAIPRLCIGPKRCDLTRAKGPVVDGGFEQVGVQILIRPAGPESQVDPVVVGSSSGPGPVGSPVLGAPGFSGAVLPPQEVYGGVQGHARISPEGQVPKDGGSPRSSVRDIDPRPVAVWKNQGLHSARGRLHLDDGEDRS